MKAQKNGNERGGVYRGTAQRKAFGEVANSEKCIQPHETNRHIDISAGHKEIQKGRKEICLINVGQTEFKNREDSETFHDSATQINQRISR
jgi:hypothetical protein